MAPSSLSPAALTLRIGTRGSPLALAQAQQTADRLRAAHPGLAAPEIVPIRTTGDRIQDRTLTEAGGKGLFTKELDDALLDGRIDLAVHSMKDVPTWVPEGIEIRTILPREDPRDAWFCRLGCSLAELPAGSVVGTASLRRQALVLHLRPDLVVHPLRGNVQTRLAKMEAGEVDATLLAVAGLNRLGMADQVTGLLSPEQMLPAVAQGAIGIAARTGDAVVGGLLTPLDCFDSHTRVLAERAMLAVLDGSCRTPLAGLATIERPAGADASSGTLRFSGLVASPDGSIVLRVDRHGPIASAAELGADAARELLARMPPDLFGR